MLKVFQGGDEPFGRAAEPGAAPGEVLEGGNTGGGPAAARGGRADLALGNAGHEAEGGEHLHVLLEPGRHLAECPLTRVGQVEVEAETEIFPQGKFASGARERLAVAGDRALRHGGGPATDDPLDAVRGHEVEGSGARAHDGLPALDGLVERTGHEGDLLELVPAVRHRRRQHVVLAPMGEALLAEGAEYDLHLLFEERAVGLGVEQEAA